MKITKLAAVIAFSMVVSSPLFADSTDTKIEDTAKASYTYRTVLENHVGISSNDGVVTLTGTVPDQAQKNMAEDVVNNIPGVLRVDNQISVVPPAPEHSDGWIAMEIKFQLLIRAHVSATSTQVKVTDGVVTLTGTADNQAQKDLTGVYAQEVEGVKSVDNEMVVKNPPEVETAGQYIDDVSITTHIRYELATHRSTSALKTKVTTTNGAVVIGGEANSSTEVSLVTALAQSIRGVKSVTNNMTVKPPPSAASTAPAAKTGAAPAKQ